MINTFQTRSSLQALIFLKIGVKMKNININNLPHTFQSTCGQIPWALANVILSYNFHLVRLSYVLVLFWAYTMLWLTQ